MRYIDPGKARIILAAIRNEGGMTADEFVSARDWYVNSWAPTFTHLRQNGYLRRTGERRLTRHGSPAAVVDITPAGQAYLAELEAA